MFSITIKTGLTGGFLFLKTFILLCLNDIVFEIKQLINIKSCRASGFYDAPYRKKRRISQHLSKDAERRNMVKTNIDEAIARVTDWQGKDISYEMVPGGITNPNYKVTVDGTAYFLKIPGAGTDFIDRDNCHMANVIAAETKAGPQVCYYFEDTGVEIFEWLDGYRQVIFGDVFDKHIFEEIVSKIRDFHNLDNAVLPLKQSGFDYGRDMMERASKGNFTPPWFERMQYLLYKCEEAIETAGVDYKPCHKDFWTNNMMYNDETGDLKVIDWEYAAMGDPYWDLAGFSTTNYLTDQMDVDMIKIYCGGWDEVAFAKLKVNKLASDISWSFWALQQRINSDVNYDYMNWYCQKTARLQHAWVDPRVDMWFNLLKGVSPYYTK